MIDALVKVGGKESNSLVARARRFHCKMCYQLYGYVVISLKNSEKQRIVCIKKRYGGSILVGSSHIIYELGVMQLEGCTGGS